MPELVYNVKFQIDTKLTEGASSISAYKERVEELEEQIRELADAQENFNNSTRNTNKTLGQTNKTTAVGNQLFFSLSDGLQDSAQFSQGFATGMRAIGNNIGFTSELAANFTQRVKDMNGGVLTARGLFNELSASLFGPGGFILAVNGIVLALTAFGDELFSTEKNADQTKQAIKELSDEINILVNQAVESEGLSSIFDPQRYQSQIDKLERLNKALVESIVSEIPEAYRGALSPAALQDLLAGTIKVTGAEFKTFFEAIGIPEDRLQKIDELVQANVASIEQARVMRDVVADLPNIEEIIGVPAEEVEKNENMKIPVIRGALQFRLDMYQREREALRELRLFEAAGTEDERQRALDIRNARIQNLEEIKSTTIMSATEIKLAELEIERDYQNELSKIKQQELRLQQTIDNQKFQSTMRLVASTSQAIQGIFGQSKAVAIAETIINTYLAAQKAAASAAIGGPIASKLAAAAEIAAGVARLSQIKNTQIGGGSISGSEGGAYSLRTASGFRGETGFQVTGEGPSYTPTMFGPRSFAPQAQINLNIDETGFGLYLQGIEGNLANDTMFVKSA